MASNLRVDQITASTTGSVSIGTATFTGGLSGDITGLNVTGVITATTLNQNVTGVVTATGGFVVGTGASVYSPESNVLTLGTNNTEKVRIDSSGNFNLVNTAGIMTAFKYETPALINNYFKSQSTTAGAYVRMYASAGSGQWDIYGNGANLRFSDNASSGNIQMDRPLSMNSQNIIMSSGYGIDFSAASGSSAGSTSALLDDYEEGTWTPALSFGGTACTMNTSGNQKGAYVRIGGIVCCSFNMSTSSRNGGTGSASMSGFPFSTSGISNLPFYHGNIQPDSGMNTLPTGAGSVMIYLGSGTSAARILYMTNDVHADVQGSQMSDSMTYYGYITYRVG